MAITALRGRGRHEYSRGKHQNEHQNGFDDTILLPTFSGWELSPREIGKKEHGEFLDLTHSLDAILEVQNLPFRPSEAFLGLVRQLEFRGPISREQPPVMARYRYQDWDGEQVDAVVIRVGVDEVSGRGFAYFSAQRGSNGAYELDPAAIAAFQIDNDPAVRQVEVFDASQRPAPRVPIGQVIS